MELGREVEPIDLGLDRHADRVGICGLDQNLARVGARGRSGRRVDREPQRLCEGGWHVELTDRKQRVGPPAGRGVLRELRTLAQFLELNKPDLLPLKMTIRDDVAVSILQAAEFHAAVSQVDPGGRAQRHLKTLPLAAGQGDPRLQNCGPNCGHRGRQDPQHAAFGPGHAALARSSWRHHRSLVNDLFVKQRVRGHHAQRVLAARQELPRTIRTTPGEAGHSSLAAKAKDLLSLPQDAGRPGSGQRELHESIEAIATVQPRL